MYDPPALQIQTVLTSAQGPFLPSAAASMRDVDPKNVPAASIAELIGLKLYYRPQKSRSKQTSCTGPRPSRQEVKEAENMVEKYRPVFVTPRVRQVHRFRSCLRPEVLASWLGVVGSIVLRGAHGGGRFLRQGT